VSAAPRRKSAKRAPKAGASRTTQAYEAIRARILDNLWPPGHQALETALADELGISRTPVREALVRLRDEGLVEVVPRHGMRVLPVSAEDMREIYEVLAALESAAAELAARRRPSAAALRPLEQATRDMERALKADDLTAWAEADERFHRQLLELSGNRLLVQAVLRYWDRSHRARMVTLHLRPRPAHSTREHKAIVARIRAGDGPGAGALFRAHRSRASGELLALFERHRLHQF